MLTQLLLVLATFSIAPLAASEHCCQQINTSANQLFGYNPNMSASEDITTKKARAKKALLCLPGLGCAQGKDYQTYFPGNQDYVSVTLNFEHTGKKQISPNDLNPTKDTEVGLHALMHLWKLGYKTALFGHSYGGGIGIKMLDALHRPKDYSKTWSALGLSQLKVVFSCSFIPIDFKIVPHDKKIGQMKQSVVNAYFEKPVLAPPRSFYRTSMQDDLYGQPDRCDLDPIELLSDLKTRIPLSFVLAQHDTTSDNETSDKLKKIARFEGWNVTTLNENHNDISESPKLLNASFQKK